MKKEEKKKEWVKPNIKKLSCADAEGSGKRYTPYAESEIGNRGLYGPS